MWSSWAALSLLYMPSARPSGASPTKLQHQLAVVSDPEFGRRPAVPRRVLNRRRGHTRRLNGVDAKQFALGNNFLATTTQLQTTPAVYRFTTATTAAVSYAPTTSQDASQHQIPEQPQATTCSKSGCQRNGHKLQLRLQTQHPNKLRLIQLDRERNVFPVNLDCAPNTVWPRAHSATATFA